MRPGLAYHEKVPYSGPEYSGMKIEKNKIVLSFKHVGGGLVARENKEAKGVKEGTLIGFTIAGADKKFVPADAVIEGDKIVVSSPTVEAPVAVRYGWANYPVVNLWNRDWPAGDAVQNGCSRAGGGSEEVTRGLQRLAVVRAE